MKKVSILIPCYNSESFLEETLRCCFNQTYSNIEIVLVDDGSSDKSLDIVKKYADDKVRVIKGHVVLGIRLLRKVQETI